MDRELERLEKLIAQKQLASTSSPDVGTKFGNFIPKLFLVVVGCLGCFAFSLVVLPAKNDIAAQKHAHETFLPTNATVSSSSVGEHHTKKYGYNYSADIAYNYAVNGQNYTSTRYHFADLPIRSMDNKREGIGGQTTAQALVDQYRPGSVVKAWYDPTDPSIAVLDNSLPPENEMYSQILPFLAIPAVMLLMGIVMVRKSSNR